MDPITPAAFTAAFGDDLIDPFLPQKRPRTVVHDLAEILRALESVPARHRTPTLNDGSQHLKQTIDLIRDWEHQTGILLCSGTTED